MVLTNKEEAISRLRDCYESIAHKVKADRAIMCLSCHSSEGWRKQVLPSYKGNRAAIVPPVLREFLKRYTLENYTSYLRPTLEGDDCLGILLTHPKIVPGRKICCTVDKDLKTIPGQHFNIKTGERFVIDKDKADYWHMYQTLVGDATDGYKGCPGIGPVKAENLLAGLKPADMWEAVVEAYKRKNKTEEDALQQARVARICRATDYDYKEKKVKLWCPKKT